MKTLLLFISFFIIAADAATVRLYFTDPLTNDKDTNAFYITPIGTNVLSSGGVVGRGVTTRYVPASNGYRTNTLAVGHYSITNRSLGSGVVIRVPDSSSLYDYTNILISGYNIFVTITNGDSGTSGALTNNDTRAVTLTNLYNPKIRIVGSGDYVDFLTNESGAFSLATDNVTQPGLHVRNADFYAENIYATAGIFSGSGAGLTSVHGSNSIAAGTISTNRMDATAYVAFNNDVTQAGLAAGSYAINGALLTNAAYANVYNVEKYGADHNIATTNDHFAIQAAIDAATNTGGGTIFFPPGNYYINGYSYWPAFASEQVPSCIVLWSNCSYKLQGSPGTKWLIRSTALNSQSPSANFNVIGTGASAVAAPYGSPTITQVAWAGVDNVTIEGIDIDVQGNTWIYDITEFYRIPGFAYYVGCAVRNSPTSGDFLDCAANRILMENCYFTNMVGTQFHPDGCSEAVMQNCVSVNCNTQPFDAVNNTAFDIGVSANGVMVRDCTFTNVCAIAEIRAGATGLVIEDCFFAMTNHAAYPSGATNISCRNATTIKGCSFYTAQTGNPFGVIFTDAPTVALVVADSSFNNTKALRTTNVGAITFSGNNITATTAPFRLGGQAAAGYNYTFSQNKFQNSGNLVATMDTDSTAHNVEFVGNLFYGGNTIATGTNWLFKDNLFTAANSYVADSSSGNSKFIGNYSTTPTSFGEIRLNGATNVVVGNVLWKLRVFQTAVTDSTMYDNQFSQLDYTPNGASATTLRTRGVWRNNTVNRTPVEWFPLKVSLATTFTESAAVMTSTALSLDVISGKSYAFNLMLFVDDSVDSEGVAIDYDGGAATMTTFRAATTIIDSASVTTHTTTLAGDVTHATLTGSGVITATGTFTPSSTGTFIIRARQNTHATGTLSVFGGSVLTLTEL